MPLVTVDAIVLQAFPYSETSKILRLLTAPHGVQSVIARGARRPKSRYGGILEPFTDGSASFYLKANRDLHTLREFELHRPRQRLGRDLVRFGAASLIAEIILRTASDQESPEIFHAVRSALDDLQSVPPAQLEAVALAHTWNLITILGFGPAVDRCVYCGGPNPEHGDLYFDYGAGGSLCGECGAVAGDGAGRVLPARARHDLAALCHGHVIDLGRTAAHWQLLARFLAYHLVDTGSLRSLDFLAEAVGADPPVAPGEVA